MTHSTLVNTVCLPLPPPPPPPHVELGKIEIQVN